MPVNLCQVYYRLGERLETITARQTLTLTHRGFMLTKNHRHASLRPLQAISSPYPILKTRVILTNPICHRSGAVRIQSDSSKEAESKAVNARLRNLQYHFSSLRDKLLGCYREDPARVFDEIREFGGYSGSYKSEYDWPGSSSQKWLIQRKEPHQRPNLSIQYPSPTFPERKEDFSLGNSTAKAEKANLSSI